MTPSENEFDSSAQNLLLKKPVGVQAAAGETPIGKLLGETHRVLECTQAHRHGNQHQKGPICLWVAGEVTCLLYTSDAADDIGQV